MSTENLMLIYGRPFEATDERMLGSGPIAALETLAARHPDLVHRPAAPSGGGWWIGREITIQPKPSLPHRVDWAWSLRSELPSAADDEVNDLLAALPEILSAHPRLLPVAMYLIRGAC